MVVPDRNLNHSSVLLEVSREIGMGKRIRLNINKVEDYSLFPGQVLAVEGKNIHGDAIQVDQIYLVWTALSKCISISVSHLFLFVYSNSLLCLTE